MHLVAAGVDVTVIRSWLGHVSLDTTNHYAQANLETKRKALERLEEARHIGKATIVETGTRAFLAWLDYPLMGKGNNVEEIAALSPHNTEETKQASFTLSLCC